MSGPSGTASAQQDTGDGGLEFPEGFYTDVKVVPINGSGSLIGGTGTCSATNTFSAGMFSSGDLPQVGAYYNIWASHLGNLYHFPGWRCAHSGPTSDFLA
jgi:hypothetical protein